MSGTNQTKPAKKKKGCYMNDKQWKKLRDSIEKLKNSEKVSPEVKMFIISDPEHI